MKNEDDNDHYGCCDGPPLLLLPYCSYELEHKTSNHRSIFDLNQSRWIDF